MWFKLIIALSLACVARGTYSYATKWFKVPLDHFGFQRNETFNIKYLENADDWDRGRGPIFFYTGNEGQIEAFAKHTGFMWEIAGEFKAKIVFAEHRYYGQSMPFGDKSLDNEHIGYLTSEQALADYAELVNYLQVYDDNGRPKYPVVVFGGSYGGMLAAYFRMKYPHLVNGAIAASAPVHMYPGMVLCDVFNTIVTSNFKTANRNCSANIRQSWNVLRNISSTANGTDWIKKNWNLCGTYKNSSDVDQLVDYLSDMYVTLAMVNYPFASDFLMPLPAYPVRVVCQYLTEKLNGYKLLEAIGKVLKVYSDYNNKNTCVNYRNIDSGNLNASGWDYQACTEMVMPICSTGISDMFEANPWNFTEYSAECHKKYNVYPRQDGARIQYGGTSLSAASNIVFSNGLRDPWTAGGILSSSVSETVKIVFIFDGAHHLDLMPSNPADTEPVKRVRNIHKDNIRKWIQEFEDSRHHKH